MSKPKKKNHITISIDEKVFDTVKYSFMIKKKKNNPLSKLEIEGNLLYLVKNICKKLYLILYINGKKLEAFPLNQEQGKDVPSHHSFSTSSWKP